MTRYQHHSAANSDCFSICKQFIKSCYAYPGVKQTSTLFAGTHQHHEPANKLPAPSWTSGLLPFKLGSANTGQMGPSNRGWLPTGVNFHPPPSKDTSSNKVPTREHGSDHHRGEGTDKQRGNCRDTSYPTELCLSDFSGGEKGWGPEARSEPKVPESLCKNRALQDGGPSPAPRPVTSTGLDGEVGPEGCLPPGPNSPGPSTPPNLPMGGKKLHVQVPTIWPVLSAKSVYQTIEASGGFLEANRMSTDNILGRHANVAPEQGATTPTYSVDLPVVRGLGTNDKPEEIHIKPHTGVGISGFSGVLHINEPVHSLRETAKNKAGCEANVGPSNGDGEGGGTVRGEGCCYAESHPISPTTLSIPPTVNEFCPSPELHSGGSEQEIRDCPDTDRSQQGGSRLVGFTRSKLLGNTSVSTMPYSDGALRCIQQGLGGSSQWPNTDRGSMVTRGSNSPYKLSGVVSSFPGDQSFWKDLAECHSVTAHRQHHSSKLHQSERGHSLQASVPISYFNVDMVQRAEDIPPSRTCTRSAQCTSRRGVQDCERPMRLDAQPVNFPSNNDSDGVIGGGPVRFTADKPACSFLQLEARSGSRGHGCLHAGLVSMQGVCQPPMVPDTLLSDQGQGTSSTVGANNTLMENTTVVSHSPGAVRGLPSKDSTTTAPGVNANGSGVSNAARGTTASHMACLRESYTSQGFSCQASHLMLASWRDKTNANYGSSFARWAGWCQQQN